jgi:hypothetical protein
VNFYYWHLNLSSLRLPWCSFSVGGGFKPPPGSMQEA